jgi:hypothetical protein
MLARIPVLFEANAAGGPIIPPDSNSIQGRGARRVALHADEAGTCEGTPSRKFARTMEYPRVSCSSPSDGSLCFCFAFIGTFMKKTALLAAALALGSAAFAAGKFTASSEESAFLAENDRAMTRMMEGMSVKPAGDVDRDFVQTMIPHHQGAIDMAQAELRHGRNEQLRRIAQEIVVEQQQEIVAMRLALGEALPAPAPAPDQGGFASEPARSAAPGPHEHSQPTGTAIEESK